MNLVYRIVWSQVLDAWVAVSEIACAQGKSTLSKLVAAALALSSVVAQAGPVGAVVASGSGSIAQSGTTTTINQSSPNLSLTWTSFNVAPTETVNFVQPSATAVAVNRIYDTNGSQIMGRLNANGQVYLINPNGVLFGSGAQINVGALVASTLDFNDASLGSQSRRFSGTGNGSVVNLGAIDAAGANGSGGFVALLGNSVSNQGSISAPGGTVALGAGSAVTLTFQNSSLVQMKIDQSVLDSQSANGGVIRANGGRVLMSAGAQDALLASVVNNTGIIEARTVENHAGTIVLLGGMAAGTTHVGGTLDAGAPNGGNGGFIETSAARVKVADTARVTTAAPAGKAGAWLIDPVDFTIAATGGDITGASLGNLLGFNSVTVQSNGDSSGTNGDIFVNDPVSWSANTTLWLNAHRNININQPITATSGQLSLLYGQGSADGVIGGVTSTYNVNAPVNLSAGANFSTQLGSGGALNNYTVITSLGVAGDTSSASLQGINNSPGNLYALGANIDASDTINWNGGLGFMPVNFSGALDGLGHSISNLTINRPVAYYPVGLISSTSGSVTVSNVGLSGGSITGRDQVGGLVGYATGPLNITNSYNTGAVTGNDVVGGLVGNGGTGLQLSKSFNLGQITTNAGWDYYSTSGGLVGRVSAANIEDVFNAGRVYSARAYGSLGGVVGMAEDSTTIKRSYNSGEITGGEVVGGIAGYNNSNSSINNSYNKGSIFAYTLSGGIAGFNYAGTVSNSYNTGTVSSSRGYAGGLVGSNQYGYVFDSYWRSDAVSRGNYFGQSNADTGFRADVEGSAQNARALTAAELNQSSNYTATQYGRIPLWDFSSVWYASGSSAPILRSSPFVATVNFGATQTYGSVNIANAVSYANMRDNDSSLVSGLILNTNATVTSGVGNYAITGSGASATNLATGLSYYFIYSPGTLTINQRPVTVTADPKTKNYGDVNPALSFTVAADGVGSSRGLVNGDSLSGSLSTAATQASSVGSYTIDASALSNGNYLVTANNGTLTINKAHLTVTANNASKTYGDANPALGTTVSGFVNGENLATSGVSGSGAASTTANATTGIGSATITAAAGTLAASNYDFTNLVNGTLTINQRPVTVTADPKTKNYGDVNPALSFTVAADGVGSSRGLVNGDSLSGSLSTAATQASSVGSYTIDASALSNGNYLVTANNGTLTISAVTSPSFAPAVEAPQTTVAPRFLLDDKRTLQFTQKSGADMNVRIVGAGVKLSPDMLELSE